ncbi:FAD-dependent oxidoreductase [Halorarum halophilum]|uniref:FAD-dependent oxidoreductase n=1 Tax=Halorarum halophilum TaxID=2743090 RepID=A0A7D5K218_9EURY|nr:FAD-dependent oxidoreductase [Halobaculum halophilum]QLG28441.1 FAD-dependent oxidoreductase [Halobaculum halophilum]
MSDPDAVAVVGGGIVGSAVAYHLAREGVETTLFDRRDEGRATDAGAGIVAPATSSRTGSVPWFEFAVEAADHYPDLVAALEADGATDHGYVRADLLSVAVDADEVDPFERAKRRTERRAEEYGTPEPGTFEELSIDEARDLFPPLSDAERAMVYRDQARVDGRAFAAALRTAGESHGLAVEHADVTDIRTEDDGAGGTGDEAVTGVVADGDSRDFDAVVVAGGAWSGTFGDALGLEVPVEPQRGQIVHLAVDADTAGWPIVSPFRHKYMVSWPDGRVAVGATREDGTGFVPRATLEGLHDVYGEALRVADGLRDAEPVETRVGLRPVARDGLPILGPTPDVAGAFLATGHGPTGLTLGPYSGKVVADLVRGVDPDADLSAFDPARFR